MRVAVLYDAAGWAQHLHAEGLRKHPAPGISVTTHLLSEPMPACEVVYVINFASCRRIGDHRIATCAASHAWMHPVNDPLNWRTRGVNPRRNSEEAERLLVHANSIVCRNKALESFFGRRHPRARYIPAGVNTDIFNPAGRQLRSGKLRVGWSGQVNPEPTGRFKGFDEIWTPLKQRLSDRFEFVENTRTAAESLSWKEMADWYRSIDVFLTTATSEGTPNGPFCAAACGAVVVSTDVGQLADWSTLRRLGLIVPDYGNEQQARSVIDHFAIQLGILESESVRRNAQEQIMASIESEYAYRVLGPKTLRFVCGVG